VSSFLTAHQHKIGHSVGGRRKSRFAAGEGEKCNSRHWCLVQRCHCHYESSYTQNDRNMDRMANVLISSNVH